jgi:type IV pilus assembly protein PilE
MLCRPLCSTPHANCARRPRTSTGFTLIELMIVVAIIGILAMIALPGYQDVIRKGRRADAVEKLASIQQAQERYRANNSSYASTLATLFPPAAGSPASSASLTSTHYDLSIVSATRSAYVANAAVKSDGLQSGDSNCAQLRVSMSQGSILYSSITSSGTENNAVNNPCWVR